MAGLAPVNADEVNNTVGNTLSDFANVRVRVSQDSDWLGGIDLTAAPYNMDANDQTVIKSAINALNTALAAVDMTFINQLIGLK